MGAGFAAIPPAGMYIMEKVHPSRVGKGGFAPIMRLNVFIGLAWGFVMMYNQSQSMVSPSPQCLPSEHLPCPLQKDVIVTFG